MATSQIAIHDHDLFPRCREYRTEIHGNERLAQARCRTREHHDIVRCFHERELQRRPETAQCFDGDIVRAACRQDVASTRILAQAFRQPALSRRIRNCRSEEHTSELQSLMSISYAVFCLNKTTHTTNH